MFISRRNFFFVFFQRLYLFLDVHSPKYPPMVVATTMARMVRQIKIMIFFCSQQQIHKKIHYQSRIIIKYYKLLFYILYSKYLLWCAGCDSLFQYALYIFNIKFLLKFSIHINIFFFFLVANF